MLSQPHSSSLLCLKPQQWWPHTVASPQSPCSAPGSAPSVLRCGLLSPPPHHRSFQQSFPPLLLSGCGSEIGQCDPSLPQPVQIGGSHCQIKYQQSNTSDEEQDHHNQGNNGREEGVTCGSWEWQRAGWGCKLCIIHCVCVHVRRLCHIRFFSLNCPLQIKQSMTTIKKLCFARLCLNIFHKHTCSYVPSLQLYSLDYN